MLFRHLAARTGYNSNANKRNQLSCAVKWTSKCFIATGFLQNVQVTDQRVISKAKCKAESGCVADRNNMHNQPGPWQSSKGQILAFFALTCSRRL